MRFRELLCDEETELHIWSRHRVTEREAQEAAHQAGLVIRGRGLGIYEVFGRTQEGRFLMIAVRDVGRGAARIITARDMSDTERRRYRRHMAH